MPYGDLAAQRVQRFATLADLDAADCTAEEREEYEPHIEQGAIVFAGVDYAAILSAVEAETDVLVWDGGNNDFPFFRPDLHIGVADALRPTQLAAYHPGEAVMRMAGVLVINKVDAAAEADVTRIEAELHALNPGAPIVRAASPVLLDDTGAIRGRRVIVVEDGPTITHGGMAYGAGYVAAEREGAQILDPRDSAPPPLLAVYAQYPHIGRVLPVLGYSPDQLAVVKATIESSNAEAVVVGSPIDLDRLLDLSPPVIRARYRYAPAGSPTLDDVVEQWYGRIHRPEDR
jgi:predicted GTPase